MNTKWPSIISGVLLLLAIFDLPYDYYTLLRWVICAVSVYTVISISRKKTNNWIIPFIISALLFNPIFPIYLNRGTWLPIDIATSAVFFAYAFKKGKGVLNMESREKSNNLVRMNEEYECVTENVETNIQPTLWKWYFDWHPRLFVTVPIFLLFVIQGLGFIYLEIVDIISFFQTKPVSWGSIFLILFFGTILFWLIVAPIYISFESIKWLYEVNTGKSSPWKKFFYSIGLLLLVFVGTVIIRLISRWILGLS